MLEDCQEEDGFSLQPELFMLALERLSAHHMGVWAFFLCQLTSLSEHINEISTEGLYLLQISTDVAGNPFEAPQLPRVSNRLSDSCNFPIFIMSLLEDSLIIGRQVGPLHKGIDSINRWDSICIGFKWVFLESLAEDLTLEQVAYLTVSLLVLQM